LLVPAFSKLTSNAPALSGLISVGTAVTVGVGLGPGGAALTDAASAVMVNERVMPRDARARVDRFRNIDYLVSSRSDAAPAQGHNHG
jgi:hypothetical protein